MRRDNDVNDALMRLDRPYIFSDLINLIKEEGEGVNEAQTRQL